MVKNTSFIAFFQVSMFNLIACLNDLIFSLISKVSVSLYVSITKEIAVIQSSAAKIVYQFSGINFKIMEAIIGVIIAGNSQ